MHIFFLWSERYRQKVGSYTDKQKHRQMKWNEQLAKSTNVDF